jgi:hypothetical protein
MGFEFLLQDTHAHMNANNCKLVALNDFIHWICWSAHIKSQCDVILGLWFTVSSCILLPQNFVQHAQNIFVTCFWNEAGTGT